MELLEDGESCSRSTLNIMQTDVSIGADMGDDNACQSGNCQCGTCRSGATPKEGRCKATSECETEGYCWCPALTCISVGQCLGMCKDKKEAGGICVADEHGACLSNNCKCELCTDENGHLPEGSTCSENSDCAGDMHCDCDGGFCGFGTINCNGTCRPKKGYLSTCNVNADCLGNKCICNKCTEENGKMREDDPCLDDSDCPSNECTMRSECYLRLIGPDPCPLECMKPTCD